jgi:nicotinate-nucleotide adenylyltransferase
MPEIALFGGSFDPPHVGHLLAAAYVLATEAVDELWLVPVVAHPFGKQFQGSYAFRVALCEKMAQLLPNARVSRAEEESGQPRTVDLLEYLKKKHPGTRWALVLGTDLNAELSQWKNFDRIRELARIITVHRAGHLPEARGPRPEATLPEVSSTQIRALLQQGGDVSRLVPRIVLDAIRAAGAYR